MADITPAVIASGAHAPLGGRCEKEAEVPVSILAVRCWTALRMNYFLHECSTTNCLTFTNNFVFLNAQKL